MKNNTSSKTQEPKKTKDALAIVGKSLMFEGDVKGDEDLRIEGVLEGSVTLPASMVTIAKSGKVRGDIHASTIFVEGEVRGELRGVNVVEIAPCGIVYGDIRSPRVMLQDGCQFKGQVDMDHKEPIINDRKRQKQSVLPAIRKKPAMNIPLKIRS